MTVFPAHLRNALWKDFFRGIESIKAAKKRATAGGSVKTVMTGLLISGLGVLLICGNAKLGDQAFAQPVASSGAINMCEGASIVPDGWIATNEVVSPSCAYPGSKEVTGRMLTIESYESAKKQGSSMTVCADVNVPLGFIVTGFANATNKCFLNTQTPNVPGNMMVKTIRYLPFEASRRIKS